MREKITILGRRKRKFITWKRRKEIKSRNICLFCMLSAKIVQCSERDSERIIKVGEREREREREKRRRNSLRNRKNCMK